MIWNIKSLVDRLKEGVKEAVETAIEERLTNTKDMQRRESVVAQRETTWKDQLYRREAEIERQELQLRLEREAFEKEKGLHNGGTASIQNNQDGALEITVDGERYRCLRYSKPKK
ncbi:uncharacterized protein LOC111794901 [Cucurbita pepo subsp. pepo]|uniref:uncharacterized protein LOC111794901 n=1 Tax=Cucurbita pepo subsp. pepo TaxID=3664 RepID=UPI000C9D27A5|nr:uncharacterized protein LOC111794901 [Cucurbita pepo subsp. pepo]